eukprot:g26308.t1
MPKPTKEAMMDFLSAGIKMMQTDRTRELLKDPKAVPHAGRKLIELQRAEWSTLGNKELLDMRMKFMHTAMRTYLQALKDRRPAVLESKRPLPRASILEFFDACNTRMDLPETQEETC